ncbi:MAG TPA: aldehyde dehydrogenase family protein [Ramlibacter sp.]|nr:aldehyde dehydrogenase family protein [Ramlibacter sp.]
MSTADPDQLAASTGHFIDGHIVRTGAGGMEVRRPSDGVPYAVLEVAGAEVVDEAVRGAHRAWQRTDWAGLAPRDRARLLKRWAELVDSDARVLGTLEAVGSTRPVRDAIAWDVPFTAEGLRFFAEYADKLGGEVAPTRSDHLGLVLSQPYGVVGAITPWNFPLVTVSWKVGAALAAGNAVVLKPSEITPFSVLRLAQLAIEAGIPPGIFNVVQGDGRTTGAALCQHPLVGKVTFTGSTSTGAQIMSACALHGPKPVTLELGGKSPQLVFDDIADLDRTAAALVRAITTNAGQEGLALAAHESYGLAAGVHTASLNRAMRAMRRIDAGTVWINRYGRTADFVLPTGGWGRSGFGKDLGRQAVEANLRHKSVLMDFSAA